jgi:hypothetical protein
MVAQQHHAEVNDVGDGRGARSMNAIPDGLNENAPAHPEHVPVIGPSRSGLANSIADAH